MRNVPLILPTRATVLTAKYLVVYFHAISIINLLHTSIANFETKLHSVLIWNDAEFILETIHNAILIAVLSII